MSTCQVTVLCGCEAHKYHR